MRRSAGAPLTRFGATLRDSVPVGLPDQQTTWASWSFVAFLPFLTVTRLSSPPGPVAIKARARSVVFPTRLERRTGIRAGYPVYSPLMPLAEARLQGVPPPVKRRSRRNACLPGCSLPRGFPSPASCSGFPEDPFPALGRRNNNVSRPPRACSADELAAAPCGVRCHLSRALCRRDR